MDEDDAPPVVYHGTDAQFNTFDMSKGRSTMFKVGSEWYSGTVNVRVAKDGKRLFRDITEIKNITRQIVGLYGKNIPHAASPSGDNRTISQNNSNVNTPAQTFPEHRHA